MSIRAFLVIALVLAASMLVFEPVPEELAIDAPVT
jgi:hypothetical protein